MFGIFGADSYDERSTMILLATRYTYAFVGAPVCVAVFLLGALLTAVGSVGGIVVVRRTGKVILLLALLFGTWTLYLDSH